jgi:glycosyltransferase involved in cell wall biosynthesis
MAAFREGAPLRPVRVLFHVTHMRRGGGIEASLLSWLAVLDRRIFAPALSIAFPTDDFDAVFAARLPADVAVHWLGREPWLSACRTRKLAGTLGWAGRVYEDVLLPQVRKRVFGRRIAALAVDFDLIIDYDMSLVRFADGCGKPLVGIAHFRFPEAAAMGSRKQRTLARYYRRYDRIVAICSAMQQGGVALFPALAARFITLYPGFDRDDIVRRAALPSPLPVALRLPLSPFAPLASAAALAPRYLISVTRLEESQKDLTTLLRAYALLVAQHAFDGALVIVGDGRDRTTLEALAVTLGVAAQVHFLGFVANPLPLVRQARLLVLSSRYEGLPTILIEALMLGQVLVSSDCPTGPR